MFNACIFIYIISIKTYNTFFYSEKKHKTINFLLVNKKQAFRKLINNIFFEYKNTSNPIVKQVENLKTFCFLTRHKTKNICHRNNIWFSWIKKIYFTRKSFQFLYKKQIIKKVPNKLKIFNIE